MINKYKFHAIFENKSLTKTLNVFQNILDKKAIPGQECFTETKIRLIPEDNVAVFSGMNSTIIGIKECESVVLTPGQVIVNAHIFYDIVRKITAPEIEVFQEDEINILTIKAGKFVCKIPLQAEDKIPEITTNNFTSQCVILNKDLSFLLESILFIVSPSDIRHYLCGVKIFKDENGIEAVGTDGHRLAISFANLLSNDNQTVGMIVPKKTLQEINRQIKDNPEGETIIAFTLHKIGFFLDNCKTIIISKLIHGTFPDYKVILLEKQYSNVKLNTKALIEATERAIIILDEKNTKAVSIDIAEDSISLTGQSDNRGYVHEVIDDCIADHPNLEKRCTNIVVNAYYLLEMTKNIKSERVIISINDNTKPILIKEENNDKKFYFLMPMIGS